MKIRPVPALLALLVLCSSCRNGVMTEQKTTWDVQCDLQVVSMPEELALPLIPNLRDPRRVESAFKDVQKLLAEKRATLVGWPAMSTKSGQRAVLEQIAEVRYATEYSQGTVMPAPGGLGNPTPLVQPEAKTDEPRFEPIPAAFETRNAGVTFEVEPIVAADGDMIEMSMVPQDVRLVGWTTATIEQNPPGVKVTVNQPRFVTNKMTTSMTFRNGERRLLAIFKVAEPIGDVEMFILRVEATKRKVTVPRPVAPPARATLPTAPPPPAPPAQPGQSGQ